MYCSCVYPAGALCPDPYGSVNHCSGSTLTALPYNKNTRHPEQFSGPTVFQPHFIIIRKCEQHQNLLWHMWRLLAKLLASTGLLFGPSNAEEDKNGWSLFGHFSLESPSDIDLFL